MSKTQKPSKAPELAVLNRPKRKEAETLQQELEREKLTTSKSTGKITNISEKSASESDNLLTVEEESRPIKARIIAMFRCVESIASFYQIIIL